MSASYFTRRERCPACHAADFEVIYRGHLLEPPVRGFVERVYLPQGRLEFEYLQEGHFILAECGPCGLVFQQEIPTDFLLHKLYEEWLDPELAFERFKKLGNLPRLARYSAEIMRIIAYLGRPPRRLKILDFGMGWGRWSALAQAFECEVYGAELSHPMLDYAHRRGIKTIAWEQIPDHRFDFIHTEQVFEHLAEPLETARHLAQALKPNGLLKISVPNGADIKRRLRVADWEAPYGSRNFLGLVYPLAHLNCFNRQALITMGRRAGLEPVKIPVASQLASTGHWWGLKQVFRNLAWPVYQNILSKGTYLFFRRRDSEAQ